MPRKSAARPVYTPNQLVALNLTRARTLRGWTQAQTCQHLEPHLGVRLSEASYSAIERSVAGTRIKQFSADELVAYARGFQLPLAWFFLPPEGDTGVDVPDGGPGGINHHELVDTVTGTSSLEYRDALLGWAATNKTTRTVKQELDRADQLAAAQQLREHLGDIAQTVTVLTQLAADLQALEPADTNRHPAAPTGTRGNRTKKDQQRR